jgi:hypothetical protein
MALHWMIWAKDAVETMFLVGLGGCTITVVWSWISVGRDAFSAKVED